MNIVLFPQDEPFYTPKVVHALIKARKDCIKAIVLTSPFKKGQSFISGALEYRSLWGNKATMHMKKLFLAQKVKTLGTVGKIAKHYRIPVLTPEDINDGTFVTALKRDFEPDLIVSISCSQIMKKPLLAMPRLGCINLHGALLPKYRGMLPSFWQLYDGEEEAGVTVHMIGPGIDDGDILLQKAFPMAKDETQHSLIVKGKEVGAGLLLEAIEGLEKGTLVPRKNDVSKGSYHSMPTKEDVEKFYRSGKKLW